MAGSDMPQCVTATAADAPRIALLEKAHIECPWSEKAVRDTIADPLSRIFIYTADGDILGYGGVRTVYETAEIYNIVVDTPYRRRGYGKQILDTLIAYAATCGCREVLLEVSEHNGAAIALYESQGFRTVSVRKKYYISGDAFVMRKEIP